MTWWAVDIRPPAEQREVLGAWLVARTGQAVEERDDGPWSPLRRTSGPRKR